MAKQVKRKSSSKKAKGKRGRNTARFVFLLVLIGLLLLAELVSFLVGKVGAAKEFPVQAVLDFNGDNQPCGSFGPWDVLAVPNGIVVSDQGHKRLLVFDTQGRFVREIGQKQAGKPDLTELSCLASDNSGNIYVMDTWSGLIRGFNPEGKAILQVDLTNKGFYGPRGVAWDGSNFLVADTGSHRVVKVSPSGSVVWAKGKRGSGKGEFDNPTEVAVDDAGDSYTVDQDNHRIQCLDPKGNFLRAIGVGAPPSAEAIDQKHKLLFVSSLEGHFVKVFNLDGKLLGSMTEAGKKDGWVTDVRALSVMDNGNIVVYQSGKIVVYQPAPAAPSAN
ncbi:MAG TPA: NHL repeat-containing protein [bacterium]|nr:NHL repeat-containing protein [bacterium]